jgi:hypothetical protein
MLRYKVDGTIQLNFSNIVYDDSEEEALHMGSSYAESGIGLRSAVCRPDDAEIDRDYNDV